MVCVHSEDNMSSDGGEQEEEEWERLQSGITRKEKVLEGTSRVSHEVHAPYFPAVRSREASSKYEVQDKTSQLPCEVLRSKAASWV